MSRAAGVGVGGRGRGRGAGAAGHAAPGGPAGGTAAVARGLEGISRNRKLKVGAGPSQESSRTAGRPRRPARVRAGSTPPEPPPSLGCGPRRPTPSCPRGASCPARGPDGLRGRPGPRGSPLVACCPGPSPRAPDPPELGPCPTVTPSPEVDGEDVGV